MHDNIIGMNSIKKKKEKIQYRCVELKKKMLKERTLNDSSDNI
jgi:tRNA A-37 threonylcarbamoyl transferase component Bud32